MYFIPTTPGSDKHSGHSTEPFQCNLQHPTLMIKVTTSLLLLGFIRNAFYSQSCSNPTVYHGEKQCHIQPCGVLPQLNYSLHLWKERKARPNKSFFFFNFTTETGTVWPLTQVLQRIQTANLGCLQGWVFSREKYVMKAQLCCCASLQQCLLTFI